MEKFNWCIVFVTKTMYSTDISHILSLKLAQKELKYIGFMRIIVPNGVGNCDDKY
jgi:hypothetical protein